MVFASTPVVSDRRFAARPVGAQSITGSFNLLKISIIPSTVVVFPVPGPPVSTRIFDRYALTMARASNGANTNPLYFGFSGDLPRAGSRGNEFQKL